jgi:hypothetical protein
VIDIGIVLGYTGLKGAKQMRSYFHSCLARWAGKTSMLHLGSPPVSQHERIESNLHIKPMSLTNGTSISKRLKQYQV